MNVTRSKQSRAMPTRQTRTRTRSCLKLQDAEVRRSYRAPRATPKIPLYSISRAPVINKPISWADYRRVDLLSIPPDDFAFHGIIQHIHSSSGQQYNVAELLVQYSSMAPGSDPSHLLNAATGDCFISGSSGNDCVVLSFQRVSVRPTAIVVKCGRWTRMNPPHWSFIFQGWDPRGRSWFTLSERRHEWRPCVKWRGFTIDTECWFRQFRFLYTGEIVTGVPSFSIEAFEIHGDVELNQSECHHSGMSNSRTSDRANVNVAPSAGD
jgi:hypothetical protein